MEKISNIDEIEIIRTLPSYWPTGISPYTQPGERGLVGPLNISLFSKGRLVKETRAISIRIENSEISHETIGFSGERIIFEELVTCEIRKEDLSVVCKKQ